MMITSVKNILAPKTLVLASMLTLGAVTGGSLRAQTQQSSVVATDNRLEGPSADIFEYITEDNDTIKLTPNDNLKAAKSQFRTLMKSIMVENPWKARTSGANPIELEGVLGFLKVALKSNDAKVSDWANKKIEELDHLIDSGYNKKTKEKEMEKSKALIEKYDAEVDRYQSTGPSIRSFLDFILYQDDYQRLSENYNLQLKYAESDRAYYKALNLLEQHDLLSSAATRKYSKGQGKRVK